MGNSRSVMLLNVLGHTRTTMTKWMSETSGSCFERSGKTEKTMSCLGSKLAIILLERGMPSRCASSKRIDYVPAICTHRPSLLPMPVGYRSTDFLLFGVWGEVDPCLTSRGSKSRNKVAVGEPAAGSFREFSNSTKKLLSKYNHTKFGRPNKTPLLGLNNS